MLQNREKVLIIGLIIILAIGTYVILLAIQPSEEELRIEPLRNFAQNMAKNIPCDGTTKITMYVNSDATKHKYTIVFVVNRNCCQPAYWVDVYYNRTIVASYIYGIRESDGQSYEAYKIFNQTLYDDFVKMLCEGECSALR